MKKTQNGQKTNIFLIIEPKNGYFRQYPFCFFNFDGDLLGREKLVLRASVFFTEKRFQ